MSDREGEEDKLICVPADDPRQEHLRDIHHLPQFHRLEIQHFLELYQELEPGKSVEGAEWADRSAAEAEMVAARGGTDVCTGSDGSFKIYMTPAEYEAATDTHMRWLLAEQPVHTGGQ